jgi:hypothetical protein
MNQTVVNLNSNKRICEGRVKGITAVLSIIKAETI